MTPRAGERLFSPTFTLLPALILVGLTLAACLREWSCLVQRAELKRASPHAR